MVESGVITGLMIQEDVNMYSLPPNYDDNRGFDLSNEMESAAINQRICEFSRGFRNLLG